MDAPEGLLEIGRIGRAHGVRGALVVRVDSDRPERVAEGARLFDGERWLTLVWARSQPQHRWVMQFAEITDRTEAERYQGRTLWGEPIDDPDAIWVHEVIGRRIVDQHGIDRGRCVAVLDNPANDLLELDTGHLVPITFVVATEGDTVQVDAPEGLFDLLG